MASGSRCALGPYSTNVSEACCMNLTAHSPLMGLVHLCGYNVQLDEEVSSLCPSVFDYCDTCKEWNEEISRCRQIISRLIQSGHATQGVCTLFH